MYYAKFGIVFTLGIGVGVLGAKVYYEKKLGEFEERLDEIRNDSELKIAKNDNKEIIAPYSPSDEEEEDEWQ